MILNLKNDNGYEIIINMDNVLYIQPKYEGGYRIQFKDKNELNLTWQEFERLTKALEVHGA